MDSILTKETREFISWAKQQQKPDAEVIEDLVKSGWSEDDASRALQEFLSLPSAQQGSVIGTNKTSFFSRNPIIVALGSVAIIILIAFGIFVLIAE